MDDKIISMCNLTRLKSFFTPLLTKVRCCIPGRNIQTVADTICRWRDIMWYVQKANVEAYFLKLDPEKEFDRVLQEYLH